MVDSGCSRTVCGKAWLELYLDTLSRSDRRSVHRDSDNCRFRFGDGDIITSREIVTIPVQFGSQRVKLRTNVVSCDVPLLLSRESLKRADAEIDFKRDTVSLLGELVDVKVSRTGHLCVPLTLEMQTQHVKQVLFSSPLQDNDDGANERKILKLHKQFAHPSAERLKQLIRNSGVVDAGISKIVDSVSHACDICKRFRKPPPRPAVGFPLATDFNETVAMDIKFINGEPVLHLIDHATRYSSGCRVRNKKPETIVQAILSHWIRIFGCPKQFLSDNGGEFVNQEFLEMCEKFNIICKTTAAESAWSNGLCERHNAVIGDMVSKIIAESQCSLDLAIPWAICAKNALSNVFGFAPNQLVFGGNISLPSVHSDKPSAQNSTGTSTWISKHLIALHRARQAFIAQESCEKLRRALNKQTRSFSDMVYQNGDDVYYKRNNNTEWHGPARVLGRDSAQYLLKHGGTYVRVHPCKMQPVNSSADMNSDATAVSSKSYIDACTQYEENHLFQDEPEPDLDDEHQTVATATPLSPPPTPAHPPQAVQSPGNLSPARLNLDDHLAKDTAVDQSAEESEVYKEVQGSGIATLPRALSRLADFNEPPSLDIVTVGGSAGAETSIVKHLKQNQGSDSVKLVTSPKNLPAVRTEIRYRLGETDDWKTAKVISKAGKATTSNWHFMNIKPLDDGNAHCVSFKNAEWEIIKPQNDDDVEDIYFGSSTECARFDDAKLKEIHKWIELGTFTEVEDVGQPRVSTRWVCTEKMKAGQLVLKARLVARGFEEDASQLRTDSPTCSKESLRMVLCILAAKDWQLRSIDIKSAYLQGHPISRVLFLQPPKCAKTDKLWKLQKTPYGLMDAGRHWYIRVVKEFTALGAKRVKCDQAIFMWEDPSGDGPCAILAAHVDDFLYGGNEYFYRAILPKIRSVFQIGTEESSNMRYLGLSVKQTAEFISLSTDRYCSSLQEINITSMGIDNQRRLTQDEASELKKVSGQINWITTQSRPDVAFNNCMIGNSITNATVSVIKTVNKTIRKVRSQEVSIMFPNDFDLASCQLVCFCDSGFANLPDSGSQEGLLVFLVDNQGVYCLIAWHSKRIKRVVNSSLAAECLAAVDAAETSILLRSKLEELLCLPTGFINITLISDSKSLVDNVHSSTSVDNKRLQIDVAILREMVERGEIMQFRWISTIYQVANALTKHGTSTEYLLGILRGHLRYDHSTGLFI